MINLSGIVLDDTGIRLLLERIEKYKQNNKKKVGRPKKYKTEEERKAGYAEVKKLANKRYQENVVNPKKEQLKKKELEYNSA